MSGYVTVANEAAGIARRNPEYAGAILTMYMNADLEGWGPFDCRDRWLMQFGISKRRIPDFLSLMQESGCLDIVDPGNNLHSRVVRLNRPDVTNRSPNRSPNRKRNRQDAHPIDIADESVPLTEPQGEPQGVPTKKTPLPPPTQTPPPVATDRPPADAGAPHWPTVTAQKPRKQPSGAYHGAIHVWDAEYSTAFKASYPWVFHGRDADGARVKSWLSTARVTEADPEPGLQRLRRSFKAYFEAVQIGEAWPRGDPASTRHYTRDIAKWLRVDPDNPLRPLPEKQSFASKELQRLWKEADDEERALGITQDHPESDPSPQGLRVLQRPS